MAKCIEPLIYLPTKYIELKCMLFSVVTEYCVCVSVNVIMQVSFPRMSTPTMVRCGSEDSFIVRRDDRMKVGLYYSSDESCTCTSTCVRIHCCRRYSVVSSA